MEDRSSQPPTPPGPPARVLNQPPSPQPSSLLRTWLPLVGVLALVGWLGWERYQRSQQPEPLIVAIADTTPPPASFSEGLPPAADTAIMNLVRGDCQTAAAHFRTARRGAPETARLWVLEGAAFVCAGAPDEARDVLDAITASEAPPSQAWWFLAQACLMQGDTNCAIPALNETILVDKRHRRQAEGQLRQLQAALQQLR